MKAFWLVLLSLIYFKLSAQFPGIEGIGRFKIGQSTISIIDSVKSELKSFSSSGKWFEIKVDTLSKDPTYLSQGERKFLFIEGIKAADVGLTYVYLTFYKDTLVRFECDYSEKLEQLLKLKYGPAVVVNRSKFVECTYKLTGHSNKEFETYIITTWKNKAIVATSTLDQRLDYNCEVNDNSNFVIEMPIITQALEKRRNSEIKRLKAKYLSNQLDKL